MLKSTASLCDRIFAKSRPDFVHGCQQSRRLFGIIEQVELQLPLYQFAEFHPHQTHQLAAFVQAFEQIERVLYQDAIVGGVRNLHLSGVGIKVGIAQFDGNTGAKFVFVAQFEGELGHLSAQGFL